MRVTLTCVAGSLVLLAAAPAAALAPTPSAAASTAPSLPVVTQKLPAGDKQACATAAGTPLDGVPWAQEFLGLNSLAGRSTGAGVTIGLVDTGFDAHDDPALAARVQTLSSVYTKAGSAGGTAAKKTTKKAAGFRAAPASTDGPSTPTSLDCVGHGTAMASLIAAPAGSGAGVHGLAPDATLVSIQGTDDAGDTDADHLAVGIDAVVRAGAQIVAVGTGVGSSSTLLDQILTKVTKAGVLVVAPARFDAQTDDGAIYPAASAHVLSVSDVGPGGLAPQDTPTGSPVAIAAPGDRVVAAGHGGQGQVTGSGPSYAVAYVAAAAALVKAYRPGLTGTDLATRLVRTATPPPGDGPDRQLGLGVLDVAAALDTEFDTGGHATAAVAPRVRAAPAQHTGLPVALGVAGGAAAVLLVAAGTAFSATSLRRRRTAAH